MPPLEALEARRPAITGHCYRMLGSAVDADDAVQETMIRAWRNLEKFEEHSSVGTWMHRIATNVCLDMIAKHGRRTRPNLETPAGTIEDELITRERTHWIEPVPDAWVVESPDPAKRLQQRDNIRLAYVTALQALPPKQRAALLLTEVVGFSAAEAADTLETSVPAINSALQRARSTLRAAQETSRVPGNAPLSAADTELVERFVAAFEAYDVEAIVALLHEDATQSMPPFTLWLRGRENIGAWFLGRGVGCRGSRVVKLDACGSQAFAQYRPDPETGGHMAWAIIVLEARDGRIDDMIYFLDTETIFPLFGLALTLPPT